MKSDKPNPPEHDGVKRSDPFSYLLGGAFFAIAMYGLVRTLQVDNPQLLILVGLFLGLAIAFWTWVASFHLQITASQIEFGQLFRPTRAIRFDDISHARQHIGLDQTSTNIDGMNRVFIWHKDRPCEPYLVINLKLFRSEDVRHVLKALKPYMKMRG